VCVCQNQCETERENPRKISAPQKISRPINNKSQTKPTHGASPVTKASPVPLPSNYAWRILIDVASSISRRYPRLDPASISDRRNIRMEKPGSHSLFRLVIFLPTAVPPLRHGVTRLRARRGLTRRSLAQPRCGSAWLGMARRGLVWLGARRGAWHRLSHGLELLEQRSAGATRHVSTIEHSRNEAITRARIHIYPVARKRGDSVRAKASERKREESKAEKGDEEK